MEGTVNQRISYFRKLKGYTQVEMAEKLGMPKSSYSALENKRKITCEQLIIIADVLKVDAYYLLCGKNHKESPVIIVKPKAAKPEPDVQAEPINKPTFEPWEKNFLTVLNNLSRNKRQNLYKFALLTLRNKNLDVESIVKDAEGLPNIKIPY